jgi:hypothetical protein
MNVFVFLGPTLPLEEARTILDAAYLPPVQMGDIYAAMKERPQAIGIIDGVVERVSSVWHKEILYAISHGVRVYGASSVGALRAAELCSFGMEGVGRIFEDYRDGLLEDDDEVAVAHATAEFGYRQVSEPMVNIRQGIGKALSAGLIHMDTALALLKEAKRMFYPERSWHAVQSVGARLGLPKEELARLKTFVAEERPNLKRDDAIAMLRRMAAAVDAPARPNFEFQPTHVWKVLRKRLAVDHTRVAFAEPAGYFGR